MQRQDGFLLALSAITTSLLISGVVHAPWSNPKLYSDIVDSFFGRDWVQTRSLPYLTSSFEYPVVAGLLTYLARAFTSTVNGFYDVFVAYSLLAGAAIAWACAGIARRTGKDLNPLYFLMPSFLVFGIYNFDLFHAAFLILALFAFIMKKDTLSAVLLGLAVDTKLVSAVLLPVLLIEMKGRGKRLRYLVAFAITVAAFNIPFAILNFSTFLQGYQFVGNYGLENAWYIWIFQDPSQWWYAKIFGLSISVLLLLRVYTLKMGLLPKSFLAIAAYLLGTYIYAPQFNLTLIPIIAVLDTRDSALYPWDGLNAMIILTWFVGCCGASWTPTLPGSLPQYFAVLRAVALALLSIGVAARAGHSLPQWFSHKVGMKGGGQNETLDQAIQGTVP
ncbi:MAG TPA: glycosyltransferase 87 family protein [Nitrososphaerales archaeon]|nr:glycosyltransferase 87 family protein [Nitrososphaerales archaeon]